LPLRLGWAGLGWAGLGLYRYVSGQGPACRDAVNFPIATRFFKSLDQVSKEHIIFS